MAALRAVLYAVLVDDRRRGRAQPHARAEAPARALPTRRRRGCRRAGGRWWGRAAAWNGAAERAVLDVGEDHLRAREVPLELRRDAGLGTARPAHIAGGSAGTTSDDGAGGMRGGRRINSLHDCGTVHCRALARRGALRVRHRRPARAGFRPELPQTEQRSRRSFACSHGALCFWLPGCCAVTAARSAAAPVGATKARRIATRSAPKLRHKQRQPGLPRSGSHDCRSEALSLVGRARSYAPTTPALRLLA